MRSKIILVVLVFSILLGLSPLAADPTIRRGIDIFATPPDGSTYYDFAKTPIPAGFFCKGSKAFTGRVALKGLPLATGTPGQLGRTDTIVERLDDAIFDAQGVAVTRLQFRALSLASIAPVKTSCGAFHAYVTLDGKQRVTTMKINRTQEGGGIFAAPLAANVRMTFIPVKSMKNKSARKLELAGSFTFPAKPIPWSFKSASGMRSINSVAVDTNGDLTPDATLPGSSNFMPGLSPNLAIGNSYYYEECPRCNMPTCHEDPSTGKMHCSSPYPYCPWTDCVE